MYVAGYFDSHKGVKICFLTYDRLYVYTVMATPLQCKGIASTP